MDPGEFLEIAREVDRFAALNYSKTKRNSAADVQRHLRSMGVLYPRNDSPVREAGGWDSMTDAVKSMDPITRRPLQTG